MTEDASESNAFKEMLSSVPSTIRTSSACLRLSEAFTPKILRISSMLLAALARPFWTIILLATFERSMKTGEWVVKTIW
jgi:hypothetical protein